MARMSGDARRQLAVAGVSLDTNPADDSVFREIDPKISARAVLPDQLAQ
jgi:hypothetical protein